MSPSFLMAALVALLALAHVALAAPHSHAAYHNVAVGRSVTPSSSSSANVTKTVLQWSRQLRTCDDDADSDIPNTGTSRIIYALGDDDPASDNAVRKHSYTGVKNVNLFNPPADLPMPADADEVVIMTSPFFIEAGMNTGEDASTYYHCQAFAHNFTERQHIIKVSPRVNYGHRDIVHHLLLMECTQPFSEADLAWRGNCYAADTPPAVSACDQVGILGAWAVGGDEFLYPPNVGYPIGGDGRPTYMMMQVHYHNPQQREVNDSVGFTLTTITKLREHDAGAFVAQYDLSKLSLPPRQPSTTLSVYVPSQCFDGLSESGVNVFGSLLHSHMTGVAMRTQHVQGGVEQPLLDYNDAYDFNFQQVASFAPDSSAHLTPQSSLLLACTYNTMQRANVTTGGIASTNEMCTSFMWYYPKANWQQPYIAAQTSQAASGNHTVICGNKYLVNVPPPVYTPLPPLPTCKATSERHRQYGQHGAMSGSDGTTLISAERWLADRSSYTRSEVLDDEGRVVLYWNVTYDQQSANGVVRFAVEAETSGWVGLGVSSSGAMIDADTVIGWVSSGSGASTAAVSLTDRYNRQYKQPAVDAWQDVWAVSGVQAVMPSTIPVISPIYYNVSHVAPYAPSQPDAVDHSSSQSTMFFVLALLAVAASVAVLAALVWLGRSLHRKHRAQHGMAQEAAGKGSLKTSLLSAESL